MSLPIEPFVLVRSTAGPAASPEQAAGVFAMLGISSAGDVDTPTLVTADTQPATTFGYGPLPIAAATVAGYSRQAVVMVRLTEADPGEYGDVTLTGTGTVVPVADDDVEPYDSHEVYILFGKGGTLGTAGIDYKWSLDGGRTFPSGRLPLGAATNITIDEANVSIDLLPPSAEVTALIALVTELLTDRSLHYNLGATVHNSADTTSDDGFGATPTTLDEAIARVNQVRAGDLLHAANVVAHDNTDIDRYAVCPAAAVDGPTAIALAVFLKSTGTAHNNATMSVATVPAATHGTADAANNITATSPTPGVIVAGDVISVDTLAPTFDETGLASALASLTTYTETQHLLLAVVGGFPSDPTACIGALQTGLDNIRLQRQRPCTTVIEARIQGAAESDEDYLASLDAAWASPLLRDERVYRCANAGRFHPPGRTGEAMPQLLHRSRRTQLVPFCARLAALQFATSPGVVAFSPRVPGLKPSVFGGSLAGFKINDGAGNPLGHDEWVSPGLWAAGFGVMTSYPWEDPGDAFVYEPLDAAPAGNTAPHISQQRVVTVVEALIYTWGTKFIQSRVLLERGKTTIKPSVADQIDRFIVAKVLEVCGDPAKSDTASISSFTFEVDRAADISETPTVLPFSATLQTGRYVSSFSGVLNVNQGS